MTRARNRSAATGIVAALALGVGASPASAASGWAPTGSMPTARGAAVAAALPDGRVLAVGGFSGAGAISAVDLYDPATGTWSPTGSLVTGRYYASANLLPNGTVLVAGGSTAGGSAASSELYDPRTGTWTPTGTMATARSGHAAVTLRDGRVLVAGGDVSRSTTATAELYDPATGTWSPAGSMSAERENPQAALLPDGRVLLAGGYDSAPGLTFHASADVFDPATSGWSATGPMAVARGQGATAVLPGGRVLVAAGVNGSGFVAGVEAYDPSTGAWSPIGTTRTGNLTLGATVGSGKVLLTSDSGAETPLLDPVDGSARTFSMAVVRAIPTLTRLADGRVLVAGGAGSGGARRSTAELFTPPTTRAVGDRDLGPSVVGTPVEQDVPVRNDGGDALRIDGVAPSGADAADFTIVDDGCSGSPVAPGASCVVRVRFAPSAVGPRTTTLAFDDNAESSPAPVLRGTAAPRPVDPTPPPADPRPAPPIPPADPGTPTVPAPAAPAPAVPIPCTVRAVVLIGVESTGTTRRPRVRLTGVATGTPAGTAVDVRRDEARVATSTVRPDGTVSVTVAAPRTARARAAARYRLVVAGGPRTTALKAVRLAAIGRRTTLSGGRVRVTGRIAGIRRPTRLRIERTPACGAGKATFGTVTTDRRGTYRAVLAAPTAREGAAVYRIRQGTRTVTLPVVVAARR